MRRSLAQCSTVSLSVQPAGVSYVSVFGVQVGGDGLGQLRIVDGSEGEVARRDEPVADSILVRLGK
ncbi:hypothetical protein [Streptomyces sp. 3N207]|uniref:hypothetical protein n=1 Tax=Streptomyces sp. 3N207 TaxID=3457417 RepID=UPI003FD1C91D